MKLSGNQRLLMAVAKDLGLPVPVCELPFHPTRRWRFDVAWIDDKVAIEIEGGAYVGGRHTRGRGYEQDLEKYAAALLLGWRVLRVLPKHVTNGRAIEWARELLTRP